MRCTACTPSAECRPCKAKALAVLFLAKGERGTRYRRALEQVGVTDAEVKAAHEAMRKGDNAAQ